MGSDRARQRRNRKGWKTHLERLRFQRPEDSSRWEGYGSQCYSQKEERRVEVVSVSVSESRQFDRPFSFCGLGFIRKIYHPNLPEIRKRSQVSNTFLILRGYESDRSGNDSINQKLVISPRFD